MHQHLVAQKSVAVMAVAVMAVAAQEAVAEPVQEDSQESMAVTARDRLAVVRLAVLQPVAEGLGVDQLMAD